MHKLKQRFSSSGNTWPTLPNVRDLFAHDPLSKLLPYQAYDPETGIFINKNSLGFILEAFPVMGADDSMQKEILSLFQELMEEDSSLQCLLWADHRVGTFLDSWSHARRNQANIYQALAEKRTAFHKQDKVFPPRIFRFILSYSVPYSGDVNPEQLRHLKDLQERMLNALLRLTHAFPWDAKQFVQHLDGLINFTDSPTMTPRTWSEYDTLADQLPSGGRLSVAETELTWKTSTEMAFRSYRVADYPETWSLNAMQRCIGDLFRDAFRIQTPFFLHYSVHCPPQSKAERAFTQKMHLTENQGRSSLLLRMVPDLESELKDYDFVRRSLNQTDRLVWTQFGVGLWSAPDALHKEEQALKSLFRINNFRLVENHSLHLPCFLSSLPMTWSEYVPDLKELSLLKTTITTECANLVPLQGEWMGTPSPGMLLLGRRGQLLNWNPFDNKQGNYNIVVVGRSGAGKSVFMQELLMSSLGVGARVFVIDVGRSFEKMSYVVDGQFIEFAHNVPLCLNPFTHIPKDDEEALTTSFSMLKAIISLMAAPAQGTTDYENALIEQGVRAAWDLKHNQATISDVADWLSQHLDPVARTLGTMLTPYTKTGIYARYFEGDNNVDFTSPMVLIELEELKEKKDLQAVVLQMFIMTITNQTFLGDRKQPFHICIDEAWDLLRGKETGVFIETLARRLRKYNGSLVIGTQSVDDFYATPGALAAFENSDWMCLLSQKKSSIRRFKESGKVEMDPQKELALESVTTRHGEFSEVMICDAEGSYAIGRLRLDPFSGLLYSTKANEYARLKELKAQGMQVADAIDHMLVERQSNSSMH